MAPSFLPLSFFLSSACPGRNEVVRWLSCWGSSHIASWASREWSILGRKRRKRYRYDGSMVRASPGPQDPGLARSLSLSLSLSALTRLRTSSIEQKEDVVDLAGRVRAFDCGATLYGHGAEADVGRSCPDLEPYSNPDGCVTGTGTRYHPLHEGYSGVRVPVLVPVTHETADKQCCQPSQAL